MRKDSINAITETFNFARWVRMDGIESEGWFLLETNPLPVRNHLQSIITDICFGRDIGVNANGQVFHNPNCNDQEHMLPLDIKDIMKKVMRRIHPREYKIGLHPGSHNILNGQPVAISLDPLINYQVHPDHPHLNIGGPILPDSFCYTDDIPGLGKTFSARIIEAIRLVTIWVLRHMIWEESKRYTETGIWIGPGLTTLRPIDYLHVINPSGKCRCGKENTYQNCHMPSDLKSIPVIFDLRNIDLLRKTNLQRQQFHYQNLKALLIPSRS